MDPNQEPEPTPEEREYRELKDKLNQDMDLIRSDLSEIGQRQGRMVNHLKKLGSHVVQVHGLIGQLHTDFGQLYTTVGQLHTTVGQLHTTVGQLHTSFGKLHTSFAEMAAEVGDLQASHEEVRGQVGGLEKRFNSYQAETNKMYDQLRAQSLTSRMEQKMALEDHSRRLDKVEEWIRKHDESAA